MWTTEYETDIASDLSAFHRVDDPMTLTAARYFALAVRLSAYSGVIAARAEKLRQDEERGGGAPHAAASAPASSSAVQKVPDSVALAMLAGDGWVEIAKETDE